MPLSRASDGCGSSMAKAPARCARRSGRPWLAIRSCERRSLPGLRKAATARRSSLFRRQAKEGAGRRTPPGSLDAPHLDAQPREIPLERRTLAVDQSEVHESDRQIRVRVDLARQRPTELAAG